MRIFTLVPLSLRSGSGRLLYIIGLMGKILHRLPCPVRSRLTRFLLENRIESVYVKPYDESFLGKHLPDLQM
jgi:hypothetical protein